MDMDKKLQKAINEQIKNELYSSYMYLAMAFYFDSINLGGFGRWMKAQAREENGHAMKLYEHMDDRGVKTTLEAIDKPPATFASPVQVFQETLKHEKKVTKMIENIYQIAEEKKDNAAKIMLQWFITEQVEEEKTASDILETLKMVADKPQALIMLDRELGRRE